MKQRDIIKVLAYNPEWPVVFKAEAVKANKALGSNCINIHHIGSTSVSALAAKPKIDIIAVVKNLFFDESQLEAIGYKYRGGFNIPLRKSFTIRLDERNINLHVFEKDDPEIELNILLRDYLRKHSDVRDKYAALKYKLIAEESSHVKTDSIFRSYTLGKNSFIQNIIKKTGFDKYRFVLCTHATEWDVAKNFRNKYFFAPHNINDPYKWTFNHPEHAHLVLYKGVQIIGYIHIQFWSDKRAVIRIIVVDEAMRNRGAGSYLLKQSEKWLKSLHTKSVHAESRQSSLKFYLSNGYEEMPFNDPDGNKTGPNDVQVGKKL